MTRDQFSQLQFFTSMLTLNTQKQPSKGVAYSEATSKICCIFTGVHPCRNVISINFQSNFIEIALRHGLSPINLLHIFGTSFSKNSS